MNADLHHLCGAYAVDALDDGERLAFESHLAGCADCAAEVAELTAAAHSLGALTETTPPPSLRASVLSGISQIRPLPPLTVAVVTPASDAVTPAPDAVARAVADVAEPVADVISLRRRVRPGTWLAAAAAAVVITVGGVAWSPWSDSPASLSAVAKVAAAADAKTVSTSKGAMNAEVAYSRQMGQAAIIVEGLPPAPSGKSYQLWFVTAEDAMQPAGLLTPSTNGHGEVVLVGDAKTAAGIGLTLEPAGGSPHPTTDPMMVLALT